MTVVVGVDPSLTTTGCARVDLGVGASGQVEALRWETWRARAAAAETVTVESNRSRIRRMLRETLTLVPDFFDLAVIEGPAMGAKYTPLADERSGFRWMLVDQLLARGPVAMVSPSTRQALAYSGTIPRGTSKTKRKRIVTEAVRRAFPAAHVPDDNVADAVALTAAGAYQLGMPWALTEKQQQVHGKVPWPVEKVGL